MQPGRDAFGYELRTCETAQESGFDGIGIGRRHRQAERAKAELRHPLDFCHSAADIAERDHGSREHLVARVRAEDVIVVNPGGFQGEFCIVDVKDLQASFAVPRLGQLASRTPERLRSVWRWKDDLCSIRQVPEDRDPELLDRTQMTGKRSSGSMMWQSALMYIAYFLSVRLVQSGFCAAFARRRRIRPWRACKLGLSCSHLM
jgi:hypothetical protein